MRDRLFLLLGIEPGEESMVSMLLTQSVFLGIFFGAFDISAHSLFLSIFDEKMMARGYVLSGLAGIILTSIYTGMQARIPFKNFATINLLFVTSVTLILWLLLLLSPSRWIIWLVFIMLGPLNILAMLGFWGTASRIFTLRQGKRLFGLVDSGLIFGVIISCYAIPVLLSFNFKSHNILLISAAAVLTGSVVQIIMGSRFNLSAGKEVKEPENREKQKSLITLFRENTYIRVMGTFIALSVMTAFFVQYSFMAVTREQYPSEADMARFLGLFVGSMMIFTILIKLLVFSYLIRNYGLRTCLALSPILVAGFTAVAIAIGMIMGFTPGTSGFLLFFMLLALSRLFSKALKDSIESPSFKVIYQTIDEKHRYEVQSGMDGTVNEIAALSSGLILSGLGILTFIKLVHFSWVLLIITVLWIFAAIKLYSWYRKSIRDALETIGDKEELKLKGNEGVYLNSRFSSGVAFKNKYFRLVCGDYSLLKQYPGKLNERIIEIAGSDINLLPVVKSIASDSTLDKKIRDQATDVIQVIEMRYSESTLKDDKIFQGQLILADSKQPQTTQILRLMRDNSVASKKLGIFIIGKFRFTEMIPEVCQCLGIPGLETHATEVLKAFGKEADEELKRYYLVSSGDEDVSKRIIRLLANNCTEDNMNFLFARIWSHSREIRELVLNCLLNCNFKAPVEEKDRLHQLISDAIGILTWNLSAKINIVRRNDPLLLQAIDREIARWNIFLFNLLSITYESASIARIRENLESGTVESVNYALEMMDMVIDESIKSKLIPLLDVIPDEEKVKTLHQFFPGEIQNYQRLVEDIVNRDYNLLGVWIRACALRSIEIIDNDDTKESLIALLFSPETILHEEAARAIAQKGGDLYKSVSERIPVQTRGGISKIISGEVPDTEFTFEKVRFLSSWFKGMNEEDLLLPATNLNYVNDISNSGLKPGDGCILWTLKPSEAVEVITDSFEGFEVLKSKKGGQFYCLPYNSIENYIGRFPEKAEEVIRFIGEIEK
jgi:ATP:ADP antiporter, AAA family